MAFDASKREILHKLQEVIDKSPKGSVDEPIVDMIERLNAHSNYVTCSSCSGRIAVFRGVAQSPEDEDSHLITKGGKWLVSSHAPVSYEEFQSSVLTDPSAIQGMVIFKHEPFIMHVQCRDEESAKELLQCGLACGFRESGIVLGNKRRMVAIRTTANAMEIPIACQGKLMVDETYLKWILDIANEKFHANRQKTDKLFAAMLTTLFRPTMTNLTHLNASTSPWKISRTGHTTVTYDNKLLILGGQGPTATNTGRLSDLVSIDLQSHSQESISVPSFPPRMYHTAVWAPTKHAMVVFGGRAGPAKPFGDIWLIKSNGSAELIKTSGNGPSARWSHTAVLMGSKMVIYGGRNATQVFDDVHILSLDTSPPTWTKVTSSDKKRYRHAAVVIHQKMFVFGGWSSLEPSSEMSLSWCDVYDILTDTWTSEPTRGSVPSARSSLSASVVDDQHVVLTGGTSTNDQHHQEVYSLNLQKMTWKELNKLPGDAILVNHTSIYSPTTKSIYFVGGGCQCFGFGAIYSSMYTLAVETTVVNYHHTTSKSTAISEKTSHEQLILVVPKAQVKTIKTLLESRQLYDKTRRIQLIEDQLKRGYFAVPVLDTIREQNDLSHHPLTTMESATSKIPLEEEVETGITLDVVENTESTIEFHDTEVSEDLATGVSLPPQEILAATANYAVLVEKDQVKKIKTHLEMLNLYDKTRRIHLHESSGQFFAVPILNSFLPEDDLLSQLQVVQDSSTAAKPILNPTIIIHRLLQEFATKQNLASVPPKFEFISDILVLPKNSFNEPEWQSDKAADLWLAVCEQSPIQLRRIARSAEIDTNEKRQSHVEIIYVHSTYQAGPRGVGWVEVRENGLIYGWDVEKVMFSSGNVTEKARMAKIGCAGETIVDMYAGIGYYVIPFLVHGKAAYVHALEWNPDSIQALRFNLERNKVSSRCTVYPGDNRISGPQLGSIADRVNLGLLPKSEHGWPVAAKVLKETGGWMHVHENVAVDDIPQWQKHVEDSIRTLGASEGKNWNVVCRHLERVKSYAPKVYHVVADIQCTPALI